MFNQYEVAACIVDEIPEIKDDLLKATHKLEIFKSIQCLADYTRKKVQDHDLLKVKKCFAVADKIYDRGNTLVKIAIENVFVFSFSSLMFSCDRQERNKLLSIMPLSLHTAYIEQLMKPGI